MVYWPARCSKARDEFARMPPGWKKSWSVGSFWSRPDESIWVSGGSGVAEGMRYDECNRRFFAAR